MSEQFLREMSQLAGEPDFRANVPPGTPLGETEIEPGAVAKWNKPASMMRVGNRTLPQRIALYDLRRHDISMVPPTIAQKRIGDYPGRFTTIEPSDWHDSDPIPIDETCEICAADPERTQPPRYYSGAQLRLHYQLVHTMEWQGIEADKRDEERREDSAQMRRLIASIATMASGGQTLTDAIQDEVSQVHTRRGRRAAE